jgi:hypothetical protein
MTAAEVYEGSDGELTRRYYSELQSRAGILGLVALNLFRAQKCSSRAKVYRGGIRGRGSYKSMAYEKKQWSLDLLCSVLLLQAAGLGIKWGWREDTGVVFGDRASWVLYVDLPEGQVSFHSPTRGKGPDYSGVWDGLHASCDRILAFCDHVYAATDSRQMGLLV